MQQSGCGSIPPPDCRGGVMWCALDGDIVLANDVAVHLVFGL